MKTLLTLLVLLFSSSVVAEFPKKLFGISIGENVKNYLELNVDTSFEFAPDIKGIDYGFFEDQIVNLIPNSRFDKYWITADQKELISKIIGFKTKVDVKNTEECINDIILLKNLLATYYELNLTSFDSNFYKYYWKDINDFKFKEIEEVKERVAYAWVTKVRKYIEGENIFFGFSCQFNKNDQNQIEATSLIFLETQSKNQEFHINFKSEHLPKEKFIIGVSLLQEDLLGF